MGIDDYGSFEPIRTDLRGLTYRQAINQPHIREIHWCFVIVTALFVWTTQLNVQLLLLGYWAFDFGMVWLKWRSDNKPRKSYNEEPPFRTVPIPPRISSN